MNQNINIGLITKQISNNKRKINKKKDDSDDENQTKIAVYDFFSKNEININKWIIILI